MSELPTRASGGVSTRSRIGLFTRAKRIMPYVLRLFCRYGEMEARITGVYISIIGNILHLIYIF